MKTAKIVIGANFGDEGKGLMTDYYANEAKKQNKSCLVVCHNGGSQKGHTVVTPDGIRHVFHHFGAGSFAGADTYLTAEYIVNPIIFNREYEELGKKGAVRRCFINKACRLTTPFDMMLNQIAEEYRGSDKHGSCGLGIFETIVRMKISKYSATVYEFAKMSEAERKQKLDNIALEYLPGRLKEIGIERLSEKWTEILADKDIIIENYIYDFDEMAENMQFADDGLIDDYDYIIFEGAQGLLLDQNNTKYMPHLTPSNTGIKNPVDIIGKRETDTEVCYVTRTYMTRHGAGRFDTECRREDINPEITDLTNVPNPYQDSIRYGRLDLEDLEKRIAKDINVADLTGGSVCAKNIKKSVAVTHCNEYATDMEKLKGLFEGFGIYVSDGMTCEEVKTEKGL